MKEGIFDGPQIRQLIKDPNFVKSMSKLEKRNWNCFVFFFIQNFLGNRKIENYLQLFNDMLSNLKHLGCSMSIKLHSHLDRFPENLGEYSEEQAERFHQDIRT